MRKINLLLTLLFVFFSFIEVEKAITNITINNHTLAPTFEKSIKNYNIFVDSKTEIITINVTREETEVITGSGSVSLKKGLNVIEIISYINDQLMEKYTLNITRGEIKNDEKDAHLRSLNINGFDIDFDETKYEYVLDIEESINYLNVSYEPKNPNAKVKLSGDIYLNEEENIIEIKVTSEDNKNTNTYKILAKKNKNNIKGVESKKGIFDKKEFTNFELKLIIIGLSSVGIIIMLIIFLLLFIKKSSQKMFIVKLKTFNIRKKN